MLDIRMPQTVHLSEQRSLLGNSLPAKLNHLLTTDQGRHKIPTFITAILEYRSEIEICFQYDHQRPSIEGVMLRSDVVKNDISLKVVFNYRLGSRLNISFVKHFTAQSNI